MILHRFCSKEEFEAYQRGEVLVNETNHSLHRGYASTSIGFCFFVEDPDEAIHILSGIVDLDYCIKVEVDESFVAKSTGRYGNRQLNAVEICSEPPRPKKDVSILVCLNPSNSGELKK